MCTYTKRSKKVLVKNGTVIVNFGSYRSTVPTCRQLAAITPLIDELLKGL